MRVPSNSHDQCSAVVVPPVGATPATPTNNSDVENPPAVSVQVVCSNGSAVESVTVAPAVDTSERRLNLVKNKPTTPVTQNNGSGAEAKQPNKPQQNEVESTLPAADSETQAGPLVEACFVCMKESSPETTLTLCPHCNIIYYCGEVHRDIHRPHDTCFPFIVRSSQKPGAGR